MPVDRLRAACVAAAHRHPQLRTTFHADGDEVRCQVRAVADCEPRVGDADQERLRALVDRESERPFDLEREVPSRWWLLRLSDRHHLVLLVVHHIVFDVRSAEVLAATLIEALHGGDPAPEPPQAGGRDGGMDELVEHRLTRYSARLRGALPALDLPFDRPWTAVLPPEGGEVRLPGTEAAAGRARDRLDCSEWQAYLLAYAALLARYGNHTLLVGVAMSTRHRWQRDQVGYFVNTLPISVEVARADTARSLLTTVRRELRTVYGLRDVTIAEVAERVRPWRLGTVHALLQTGASYVRYEDRLARGGVELEIEHYPARGAKSPLALGIRRSGRSAQVRFEYARGLFETGSAERVAGEYGRLLEAIAGAPDEPLARLDVVGPAGRRQLVAWCSGSRLDVEGCVHELIAERAAAAPAAPAVGQDDRVLSYGDLDHRASQLAKHLRGLGVGPEVPVGVCMRRSPEAVVAILAILKAGGAYLPLDPEHPPERLATMLRGTATTIVVADPASEGRLPDSVGSVVCVDGDRPTPAAHPGPAPSANVGPDTLVYVIHTSGSTGQPKGVMVSHGALASTIAVARQHFRLDRRDVVMQAASLSFDISALEMFMALTAGARLQLLSAGEELSGEVLDRVLREHGVSTMVLPPSVLDLLPSAGYPRLTKLAVGGEACPADTIERWGSGRTLINGYGPTEAAIYATAKQEWADYDPAAGPPPIGQPIPNAVVRVLDREGGQTPIGVPGELYLGGAGVARGYAGQPAQTAERFVPDPFAARPGERLYRTGDAVRWLASGDLEFIGRVDAQIKLRGHRIEPGEIEAALRRLPQVRESLVALRRDDGDRQRLVGYVVAAGQVAPAELREHLLRRLPRHMVPSAWVFLEAIPLTPNGKVDRAGLPAPDWGGRPTAPDGGATHAEEALAALAAQLLDLPAVGPADDLFDLGADSIFATRMAARLRASGFDVPLRAIFEAPTMHELAGRLTETAAAAPIAPLSAGAERPLSLAQERLWLLDQIGGGRPEYNVPVAIRLRGALDVPALEAALAGVVARHEALGSAFPAGPDGLPGLRASDAAARLAVFDLAAGPDPAAAARDAFAAEVQVPFDLARGPLLRAVLYRLGQDDHVLGLCLHHAVVDGWSARVLAADLDAQYTARRQARPAALGPLALTYADYAAWQRERLKDDSIRLQVAYWRDHLAGLPALLALPTDRPRPLFLSPNGRRVAFEVEPGVAASLRELARRRGATLFMTLLAGFQALLSRYAGTSDVVVGSPVSNRPGPETEGLVGLFTNMVALRTDCSGDPSFAELVDRAREVTLAALAHQEVPFEHVLQELAPARETSAHPVFQVVFSIQEDAGATLALDGLAVEGFDVERRTAKYDLALAITPSGAGLRGELEYSTDLFDAATVERMAVHLRTLLAAGAADPDRRLAALPLAPPEERRRLLATWGAGGAAPASAEVAAHELVAAHATGFPDAPAVRWHGPTLSYGRLQTLADELAGRLRLRGAGPETVVAVCCERTPAVVVAALAAHRAGGAHLLLDPAHPRARRDQVLDDVRSAIVVADRATACTIAGRPEPAIVLEAGGELVAPETGPVPGEEPAARPGPDALAYVVYTSGSTGTPKGIAVPHGPLANVCAWYRRTFQVGPGDVVAHVVGTAFDVAVLDLWGALAAGATLALPPDDETRRDPERLLAWLDEAGVTVAFVATPMAELLLRLPPPAGLRLRWLLVGGDKLRVEVPEGLPYRVADNYGPAECAVVTVWDEVRPGTASSLARVVDGCRALVASAAGEPCPTGVPGELLLGGAAVARGYVGRPDMTVERFVPDPAADTAGARVYRTGDRCRWLPDGRLEFLGRLDRQVKVRGFRVELDEVETVLTRHRAVARAAVVLREDRPGDRRLVAYVVLRGGTADELRRDLAASLPDPMVPGAFVALDALPMTLSGKIDRRALPPPPEPDGVADAPRTPTEAIVAKVWAGVLGRRDVGVTEDFFLMGGNSLLAAEIVALLRAERWPAASMRQLLAQSTVRGQSRALDELERIGANSSGTAD